jgi:hypothetical protein
MLMLHRGENKPPDEYDLETESAAHGKFIRFATQSGRQLSYEVLKEPETARTIRRRGEDLFITDGPYAELREVIGGYYIIEAESMDEAVRIAFKCPNDGAIEIRPVWDVPVE